jgi:gamma-glutamyltranspeptidase/glutathione hydrolase
MKYFLPLLTLTTALGLSGAALAQANGPEMATKKAAKTETTGARTMIATANPMASQAGADMMAQGGSAVDAAIAASLVLGLVEPQSSGIGGGGFMVHYDADSHKIQTYDGRETAPSNTTPNHFMGQDGKPVKFFDAIASGRVVGTPSQVALLAYAHKKHGVLPWAKLFEPAIKLASDGFPVPYRLGMLLSAMRQYNEPFPDMKALYYTNDGGPWTQGMIAKNPAYADTLRDLAAHGADAFYRGPRAKRIVDAVAKAIDQGPMPIAARISLADLANYRVIERDPVCGNYHEHRICAMGPPASGGIAILETLGQLESFDLRRMGPMDPKAHHLILEASRRAFADRDMYVADPDKVSVPTQGLIDPAYIQTRAKTIDPAKVAMAKVPPGVPAGVKALQQPGLNGDKPGTSHLSVVDARGNAVSMTQTIETAFGSRIIVDGFLLNNQLTDFTFVPERDGAAVANAPGPGKRPRSTMTPAIVMDNKGQLEMVAGSPGGSAIAGFVLKTLIAHFDWGMGAQASVDWPIELNRNGDSELEAGTDLVSLKPQLEAMGHTIKVAPIDSGLNVIIKMPDGTLTGASDPRRDGIAVGGY